MVVPLPGSVLDLLLVLNIAIAVLALLSSMFIARPLDFSIFPSFLLVATLFRLGLNIASTRLILLHGYAGNVIQSFGRFVIGGSLIVGLVIFLILIVIQFAVVTNGAGRVAEVAARFTLDAMPGKQMAVDADLNAGIIDEGEARRRRREIADEADFYGAMDGASKFVKGDAIAAIVIVLINIVGGFAMGILQHGMSPAQAIETYSLLTVGDGLVSQIPALLISMSAGLIVTRAATEDDLGTDLMVQLTARRPALRIAGPVIAGLAIFPGLPKLPFIVVGGLVMLLASRVRLAHASQPVPEDATPPSSPETAETIGPEMRVEPLELDLAYDMIDLVDDSQGTDLLDRVRGLRKKLARELGFVIPALRIRDNVDLPPSTYAIKVHGVEFGRGEAPPGRVLAIGDDSEHLPGLRTREPVFGLPATWVPVEFRAQAELANVTVVDRASVITTHLSEIVRANAARLLSRQDVRALLDLVRETAPVVADEVTASGLTLADIQSVLQELLDEGVSIRDIVRICEVLSARASMSKDTESLVEAVRAVLGPAISASYAENGRLAVIALDPVLEHELVEHVRMAESGGTVLACDAARLGDLVDTITREARRADELGQQPVLLCAARIRPSLRRLLAGVTNNLPVLAYHELGPNMTVENIGMVSLENAGV
jgi:flagellar biosynthesis protein FlhA